MTAHWVKYDGSDDQIVEIAKANNGWIVRLIDDTESTIHKGDIESEYYYHDTEVKAYLICEPHPYADMICQWARTGQPVWVRYAKVCHFGQTSEYEICNQIATPTPDWNIPGAEYSFTPFEEEV